jgi:hypothetical protein
MLVILLYVKLHLFIRSQMLFLISVNRSYLVRIHI